MKYRATDVTDDVLVILYAETIDSAYRLLYAGMTLHLKRLHYELHL